MVVKQNRYFFRLFLVILSGFNVYSCKLNFNEPLSWDTDLLAPIATSTVGIEGLISDSTLLSEDPSGLLLYTISDTLATRKLEDLITVPDTISVENQFDLASFSLEDTVIEQSISLGRIANEIEGGQLIIVNDGNTVPIVPPQAGITAGPFLVDGSDFFEYADLTQGELEVTFINGLPLDISNVRFEFNNQISGDNIVTDGFPSISSNSQFSRTYDLSGKRVESNLSAILLNIDIAGGVNVPIDTSDNITIQLGIKNLKASEAVAIFPSQTVQDVTEPLNFSIEGEEDVELTYMKVDSGKVEGVITSTIEDSIQFFYSLPSTTNGINIPTIQGKILPAIPPQASILAQEESLDGYFMDLTFDGTQTNSLTQRYKIDLIYSGRTIKIDSLDSLSASIKVIDVQPSFAQGYFGSDSLDFEGEASFSFFDDLNISSLNLSNPSANLRIVNQLGIYASINIQKLTGFNENNQQSVDLLSEALGVGIDINRPFLPDTLGKAETIIPFSQANSNIRDFINSLPNKLSYKWFLSYNHLDAPKTFNNFATDKSEISAILDISIPMEGALGNLQIVDTTDWQLDSDDIENIQGGTLRLLVENSFPLSASLSATVWNSEWGLVDTLLENGVIEPGIVSENGIVEVGTPSSIEISLSKEELIDLSELGSYVILTYELETIPQGEEIKIYSHYSLSAELVAELTYNIEL